LINNTIDSSNTDYNLNLETYAQYNQFINNSIKSAVNSGVRIWSQNNRYNNFSGNNISGNGNADNEYGVYIYDSNNNQYNRFFNNYFSGNYDVHIDDNDDNNYYHITPFNGTNIMGGSRIGGNYWDDLDCVDHGNWFGEYSISGDGICDDVGRAIVSEAGTWRGWDSYPINDKTEGCAQLTDDSYHNVQAYSVIGNATLCTSNINTASVDAYALYPFSNTVIDMNQSTFTGDTATNRRGIRFDASTDNATVKNGIFTNYDMGAFFDGTNTGTNTSFNTLHSCDLSNNDYGVKLEYAYYNQLINNTIDSSNTDWNIYLSIYAQYNQFTNNSIKDAVNHGIVLWSNNNKYNNFSGNNISGNGNADNEYGVYIYQAGNNYYNRFFNNYFSDRSDNQYHVYDDDANNYFSVTAYPARNIIGGPTIAGNYWSGYTDVDRDGDGIGESSYNSEIKEATDTQPLASYEGCMNMSNYYTWNNNITQTGEDYYIEGSIELCTDTYSFNDSADNGAFIINTDNVYLQFNGSTMLGNLSGTAIYSNKTNLTLVNLTIQNFTRALYFEDANNTLFEYFKINNGTSFFTNSQMDFSFFEIFNDYASIYYDVLNITKEQNTTNNIQQIQNFTILESTNIDEFNTSAKLTFYGVEGVDVAAAFRNGAKCGSFCSAVTTLGGGNYTYNVTSFTNYTVTQGNAPPVINSIEVSPTAYYNANITLVANITDANGGADIVYANYTVTAPNNSAVMTNYNATTDLTYWNSSSFILNQAGTYNYSLAIKDSDDNTDTETGDINFLLIGETLTPTSLNQNASFNVTGNVSFTNYTMINDATLAIVYDGTTYTRKPNWFNDSWKYRTNVTINTGYAPRGNNTVAKKIINFTQILDVNSITGNLDPNSIRVTNTSGTVLDSEIVNWITENKSGMLRWKMSTGGTLTKETNYTYFVYYDLIENGVKDSASPSLPKEFFLCSATDAGTDHYYAYSNYNRTLPSSWTLWDPESADEKDESTIADFDNDGDLDIVYTSDDRNSAFVYSNDGDESWSFSLAQTITSVDYNWNGICEGDFNEDGWLDLVINDDNCVLQYYENDGDGTFTIGTSPGDCGSEPRKIACGDIDGDNNIDVIGGAYSGCLYLIKGDGDGTFTDSGCISDSLDDGDDWHGVWIVDADNDGDMDIYGQSNNAYADYFENTGDGTFENGVTQPDGGIIDASPIQDQWGSGTVGDYDNDGAMDIIEGSWTSGTSYMVAYWGNNSLSNIFNDGSPSSSSSSGMADYSMFCGGPDFLHDLTVYPFLNESGAGPIDLNASGWYTANNFTAPSSGGNYDVVISTTYQGVYGQNTQSLSVYQSPAIDSVTLLNKQWNKNLTIQAEINDDNPQNVNFTVTRIEDNVKLLDNVVGTNISNSWNSSSVNLTECTEHNYTVFAYDYDGFNTTSSGNITLMCLAVNLNVTTADINEPFKVFGSINLTNGTILDNKSYNIFMSEDQEVVSWWDSNWMHRKEIVLTENNGSNLNDFQVEIDISDLIVNNSGLVASWHFNEGSGTRYVDSSPSHNENFTSSGNPSYVDGVSGTGMEFDGDDRFIVDYRPSMGVDQYTVALWMKPDAASNDWEGIIGKVGRNYNIWYETNTDYIHHRYCDESSYNNGAANTPAGSIIEDEWNYVAITNNGTGSSTYLNGVLNTTGNVTGDLCINTTVLNIGRSLGGSDTQYYNGILDEIKIHNKSLSAGEIKHDFCMGAYNLYQDGEISEATYNSYNCELKTYNYSLMDLRVTDISGNEIPFYVEGDTKLWVKTNLTANNNKSIYVYYGNSNAGYGSNGDSVFKFFDDFNSGSLNTTKWTATTNGEGNVTVDQQEMQLDDGSNTGTSVKSAQNISHGIFETRVGWKGLHSDDIDLSMGWSGQRSAILGMEPGAWESPHKVWNGSYYVNGTKYLTQEYHDYQLISKPGNQTSTFDGEVIRAYNTTTPEDAQIYFSMGNYNPTLTIDYVWVRDFVSSEPSTTASSEQNKSNYLVSNSQYNYTLITPSSGGNYVVKVNSTYDSIYGEGSKTLAVYQAPAIDSIAFLNKQWNQNMTIQANMTDDNLQNVNFTVTRIRDNVKLLDNVAGTNISNSWNASSINLTECTEHNYTVYAYDYSGYNVTSSGNITIMCASINFNATYVEVNNSIEVYGVLNLTNGTNVFNNTAYGFVDGITQAGTSDWWDASYLYQKDINITNNDGSDILQKGYTINISLDTTGIKFLDNGNDVRIVYNNGTSYTELDRINDTAFDSSTTKLLFKVQKNISVSSSDSNYSIYYGNSVAGTPPTNQSNIYWFFDDFNRANNADITSESTYSETGSTEWEISSNQLKGSGGSGDPNKLKVASLGSGLVDVELRTKIYVDTYGGGDGARPGLSTRIDGGGQSYNANLHSSVGILQFLDDGRAWGSSVGSVWATGQWYGLKFWNHEDDLKARMWSTSIDEPDAWTLTQNSFSGHASGLVGIAMSNQNDVVYYDDFSVRLLISSEPTIAMGDEEAGFTTNSTGQYSFSFTPTSNGTKAVKVNSTFSGFYGENIIGFRVGNNIPTVDRVNITSSSSLNYSNGTLTGAWNQSDNDGDSLTNETQWWKGSVLNTTFANLTSIESANLTKGEVWNFSVRVFDGYAWSAWSSNSSLTIVNYVPTIQDNNLTSSDVNNYSNGTLTFAWTAIDLDSDALTQETQWWNGATLNTTFANFTTVQSDNLTKDEVWNASVRVHDGSEWSAWSSNVSITIANQQPTVDTINVTSSNVNNYSNGTLTGAWNQSDLDNDAITDNQTQWWNGATLNTTFANFTTIQSANLTKGEVWNFSVRVHDGSEWSAWGNNVSITIANQQPTVDRVNITSSSSLNYSNGTLTGAWNQSDKDGDSLTNETQWWNGATLNTTFANFTTIENANLTKGEVWNFSTRVYDGTAWSEWSSNSSITIINSPATVANTVMNSTNTNNYTSGSLQVSWSFSDVIDSDTETNNETKWTKDGILQNLNNYTTIDSGNLSVVEVWNVSVRVYDGEDWSSWGDNVSIIIANQQPNVNSVNVTSSDVNNYSNGTLTGAWNQSDADNDAITLNETQWWNDATLNTTFANFTSIESANLTKGDVWNFSIRVYDGNDWSDWSSNTSITLVNIAPTVNTSVASTDTSNYSTGDLYVNWTFSDEDEDTETNNETKWTKDGVLQSLNNNSIIDSANLTAGETWNVSARVYDGTDWSSWSDNATILIASSPSPAQGEAPAGGGGGGGGGMRREEEEVEEEVDKLEEIYISVKSFNIDAVEGFIIGDSFKIINEGNEEVELVIELIDPDGLILLEEQTIVLQAGGSRWISFDVIPEVAGVYTATIRISYLNQILNIPIIINVDTEQALFDISLNILGNFKTINTGKKIVGQIFLLQAGRQFKEDVTLNYVVKDFEGNTLLSESETLMVFKQKLFSKALSTQELPEGEYVWGVEVVYSGGVATASSQFSIVETNLNNVQRILLIVLIVSGITFAMLVIVIEKYKKLNIYNKKR
jgi:hypothetical protein